MDIIKSEARSTEERSILRDLLKYAGNTEQQRPAEDQLNAPNLIIPCDASLHTPLRPIEANSEDSMTQDAECCEPSQIDLNSETGQTNSESNTAQERQYLGPFVVSSSIKCPKCPAVLSYYSEIFTHFCISEDIYRESCKKKPKCCFCTKEFSNMNSLKKHFKKYFKKKYVKCSICGKYFTCVSSFKMHVPIHTNQWPYYCDICGQGVASERLMELHKTTHKEKSCICEVCGAMFHNQLALSKHKGIHKEKTYECDRCFKKFRALDHVRKHKIIHSVREKYKCEECSSAFMSEYSLKLHKEMKHSDNSGGESFICSICSKEFKHILALRNHMYHHKNRNKNIDMLYTCDICKRNFTTKQSLGRHIAEHNGKQFSCNHCGKLFTQLVSVKRHMLKVHSLEG